MNIKPKQPDAIRSDALQTAIKKGKEGCAPCTESYLKIAKDNGASDSEIAKARNEVAEPSRIWVPGNHTQAVTSIRHSPPIAPPSPARPGDTLRTVAKVGAAAIGATAAASRVSGALAYQGLFGTDSGTEPHIGGMPTDFYIGKLGQGNAPQTQPGPYFDVDSARATNSAFVTGFWYMYGPRLRGSYTPYNFGFSQAHYTVQAWTNNPYCCNLSVFADVEDDNNSTYGWTGQSQSDNAACLNGWLDGIRYYVAVQCGGNYTTLSPGVYFSQSGNGNLFASNYVPSQPFAFWGTGNVQGVGNCNPAVGNCPPCRSGCDTLTPVQNNWNNYVRHACFAGQGILIWQFWISNCGCSGDFDYATTAYPLPGYWPPTGCH
jgi:hypothetical protein